MVPSLLLAAALAAPALASPFPTEKELRAEAKSWVAALCARHPESCDAAREALDGYQLTLPKTEACERGPCAAKRIEELSNTLFALDRKAAKLPGVRGRQGNGLLRLSSLGSVRLAAAAARIKNPDAAREPFDQETLAPKQVEQVCLQKPELCDKLRGVYQEALRLKPELAACRAKPCPFKTIDELTVRAHEAMNGSLESSLGTQVDDVAVFTVTNARLDEATKLLAAQVDGTMSSLNAETSALEKKLDAAGKSASADVQGLPAEGAALTGRYQDASVAADRLTDVLGYDKAHGKREAIGTATVRVSALRGRALALLASRGFSVDRANEAGVSAAAAGATNHPKGYQGTLSVAPATLLDKRTIPLGSGVGPPPPPIVAGDPSWLRQRLNLRSDDPMIRADAERRLGQTTTIGSPGLYAKQVYAQGGESTCGIASQVSVLRVQGLLPASGDPLAQEKQITAEAHARDFWRGGTPPEYFGEELIVHGMLVDRKDNAAWTDLVAAIRRGNVIQARVNAAPLWGYRTRLQLTHAILITGAEIEKKTGKILGVYINDTGSDPPRGGRFITLKLLKSAWLKTYAEVR